MPETAPNEVTPNSQGQKSDLITVVAVGLAVVAFVVAILVITYLSQRS